MSQQRIFHSGLLAIAVAECRHWAKGMCMGIFRTARAANGTSSGVPPGLCSWPRCGVRIRPHGQAQLLSPIAAWRL